MESPFLPYINLISHAVLSLSITFIITTFNIPIILLQGLHTYIHPENVGADPNQSNLRAAIRRPESSQENPEPKRRHRSKDKVEFDESNAQIFRLRLVDAHLRSRLYFSNYQSVFVYSSVALSNLFLRRFLPEEDSGIFSTVPIALVVYVLCKVSVSLVKAAIERSASTKSEKQLSILLGVFGFLFVLLIVFIFAPSVLDFDFSSANGFARTSIAIVAAGLVGSLYVPATRAARSFWLGTDQLQWNLAVISCGTPARMLLYINYLMVVFTSLLWINPVAEILVKKMVSDRELGFGDKEKWVGNVGLVRSDFLKFRTWCLLGSAVLQLLSLRPNLQMYLNEAVLSWYQRLHTSKVPDLDFGRAKIFLHNYYLCLVVLQFFSAPALVLLFLSLSQIQGNLFGGFKSTDNYVHYSSLVKEVALFMAWWVVFIWAVFTSASLALYRYGILLIS
ncbi:uncharacterized protein LOC131248539 [Magnolia sinica]|uniref:uncharacterized protein LOC131248539 n=1 Tax=Magnolia sinica TaxID=86752 RepID=UPI002659AF4C|nr:uncharacterized protein LOC131248539 [Magnolia sinica]